MRLGLTGGMASGKSTAARILQGLGARLIDTDAIARQLTGPGGAASVSGELKSYTNDVDIPKVQFTAGAGCSQHAGAAAGAGASCGTTTGKSGRAGSSA